MRRRSGWCFLYFWLQKGFTPRVCLSLNKCLFQTLSGLENICSTQWLDQLSPSEFQKFRPSGRPASSCKAFDFLNFSITYWDLCSPFFVGLDFKTGDTPSRGHLLVVKMMIYQQGSCWDPRCCQRCEGTSSAVVLLALVHCPLGMCCQFSSTWRLQQTLRCRD